MAPAGGKVRWWQPYTGLWHLQQWAMTATRTAVTNLMSGYYRHSVSWKAVCQTSRFSLLKSQQGQEVTTLIFSADLQWLWAEQGRAGSRGAGPSKLTAKAAVHSGQRRASSCSLPIDFPGSPQRGMGFPAWEAGDSRTRGTHGLTRDSLTPALKGKSRGRKRAGEKRVKVCSWDGWIHDEQTDLGQSELK